MMAVNNFRDLDGDIAAGKKTLAAILGNQRAQKLPGILIWLSLALLCLLGLLSVGPKSLLFVLLLAIGAIWGIFPCLASATDSGRLNQALKRISFLNLASGVMVLFWTETYLV